MHTLFMKLIKISIWIGLPLIMFTGGLVQCQNVNSARPTGVIYPQNDDELDEEGGFGEDDGLYDDEEGNEAGEGDADEEDR